MITVFARDFGGGVQPPAIQSVYFNDGGVTGSKSYLSGAWSNDITADATQPTLGYTISTWVKPDWAAGNGGVPSGFVVLEANTSSNPAILGQNQIVFGYDSETTYDSVFLHLNVGDDEFFSEFWLFAPVADDPFNAAITGISPSGTGYNSWNNTTAGPEFVHLAVHFDSYTPSPTNSGDLSLRGTIYWNGQALRTYEYFTYPNMFLSSFVGYPVQCSIGNYIYGRNHWQDRTSIWNQVALPPTIESDFYGFGTPSDPVPNTQLHYNYENPNPWDSNGSVNYTMSLYSGGGGLDPVTDPTQGVA